MGLARRIMDMNYTWLDAVIEINKFSNKERQDDK